MIGGVFIVVGGQFAVLFGGLNLGSAAHFLEQFDHPSHGGAVDRKRAGTKQPNVKEFAYFFLVT